MYYEQDRIYCGVCNKSVIPNKNSNHLNSQCQVTDVLKNEFTNSMIKKHIT